MLYYELLYDIMLYPDFHAELIPVQSPLPRESYLVDFPPLAWYTAY